MSDNLSYADLRAATCNDGLFGGNGGGLWLLAILWLCGGGNFGNRGNCATTEDLASGFNFQGLNSKGNDILSAIGDTNQNIGNAVCQLGYKSLEQFGSLSELISSCCCAIKEAISSLKFDLANYSASTNQTIMAGVQSIKDMFRDYREQDLRDENMKGYIRDQFYGVVRWPNSMSYSVDCNPFSGGDRYFCRNSF